MGRDPQLFLLLSIHLPSGMDDTGAMKKPVLQDTEAQLGALIAECHHMIREVALPAAATARNDLERRLYLSSAIELVRIAATVADTVGRLRGGSAAEHRQRITVERIEKRPALPACPTAEGEGG